MTAAAAGGAVGARSADGRRLHLQHGPIDLLIEADGEREAVDRAYLAAGRRFTTVLDELVTELEALQRPVMATTDVAGPVARRMVAAVQEVLTVLPAEEVTAMAAVAGSVADEILDVLLSAGGLERCFVNDGGDIAFHLAEGTRFRAGLVGDLARHEVVGTIEVDADSGLRGLATSGAGGRSFTLGIADAVTVLAPTAAVADVAATLVANAVDLPDHPGIERAPARDLDAASDLGDRRVTVRVPPLRREEVEQALAAGTEVARRLVDRGVVGAVVLSLDGQRAFVEDPTRRLRLDPGDRGGAA
jgi:uncharacterized protein